MQSTTDAFPIWHNEPEPDVWWGEEGIDALLWADPRPYDDVGEITASQVAAEVAE
jgi:hypothetical protein